MYDNPKLDSIKSHSYFNLFKIFPREIYISSNYKNIDTDLLEIFKSKDKYITDFNKEDIKKIQFPISYTRKLCHSLIFAGFIVLIYYSTIFRYVCLFCAVMVFIKSIYYILVI